MNYYHCSLRICNKMDILNWDIMKLATSVKGRIQVFMVIS